MRIDFVTLFPDLILGAVDHSIMARARDRGLVAFRAANPRDFAYDPHRTVDDSPYGDSAGMVLRPEPVARAVEWVLGVQGSGFGVRGRRTASASGSAPASDATYRASATNEDSERAAPESAEQALHRGRGPRPIPRTPYPTPHTLYRAHQTPNPRRQTSYPMHRAEGAPAVILTDPTGERFSQNAARELAGYEHAVFVCGRYEGIDDRIRSLYATHVYSIGDFIVTGGELPALLMADAVVRLIPGVLGSEDSLRQDSHSDGLLSAPQFTRPEGFLGVDVPEALRSGNHKEAARWRRTQALNLTRRNRPDLFCRAPIAKSDLDLLSF